MVTSAVQALLDRLGRGFTDGCLIFTAPDGRSWRLGEGAPQLRIRLRHPQELPRMLIRPALAFGERYAEGGWEPDGATLRDVLALAVRFTAWRDRRRAPALARVRSWLAEHNTPLRARDNVERHYNLDEAFYAQFLDRDLHYSCAYFADASLSLEQAQHAKCALIARKLDLKPGARVLDIGCGWGSLALYLAEHAGAEVLGITLSETQLRAARRRAQERGLQRRVQFELQDYRELSGQFDAVVSVGMFEHVGRPQYRRFFQILASCLKPEGTALLHTIGRPRPPGATNPWIQRYIFPGGYIPSASEVLSALEASGLLLNDLEVWRLHYARTLAEWHRRFQAQRAAAQAMHGERFCRMWEFYLQACEASFRVGELVVFQLQLSRSLRRLPLTRDYLYLPQVASEQKRVA